MYRNPINFTPFRWLMPVVIFCGIVLLSKLPIAQADRQLAPATNSALNRAPQMTGVITVTKSVDWNGAIPNPLQQFTINIAGPNSYSGSQTVTDSNSVAFTGLEDGIYTVTESSPGAGWVTTYTVDSTASATNGVVTLEASNPPAPIPPAAITGTVYRDFDSDGELDAGFDAGQDAVTISAFEYGGAACGNTQSGTNGTYSLTPSCNGPWRIEFSNVPTGTYPSQLGTGNGGSAQFVTSSGASDVNFAINAPCDYCQTNPDVVVPAYIAGARANSATSTSLYKFPYNSSGSTTAPTPIANIGDTGTLYGIAHDRQQDVIYAAAFLKRHADLGPSGGGAIYTIDPSQPPASATSLLIDLNAEATISTGASFVRDLAAPGSPNTDGNAFPLVGKWGLGDLELDVDTQQLYVVNLFERKLVQIDLATSSVVGNYQINDPGCNTATEYRPFGLGIRDGKIYVGVICDTTLNGYVLELQANGTFTTVLSDIPMTVSMPDRFNGTGRLWNPWVSTYPAAAANPAFRDTYPSPLLADIGFTANGNMLLSFRDRFGDQTGETTHKPDGSAMTNENVWTHSQILQACKTASGWTTAASCTIVGDINTRVAENASNIGAIASLKTGGAFITAIADPITVLQQGTARWGYGAADETANTAYAVVSGTGGPAGFAKGNGLGDIELLCDPAPTEIGSRVWDDGDGDGIQDPGEPGLNSVTVSLDTGSGTLTDLTDGDGNFSFAVDPSTPYTLTIAAPPAGYALSPANADADSSNNAISDVRDSDATLVSNTPTIYYTTGSAGQNNHGLGFGFTQPASGQVAILNTAPPNAGPTTVEIGNFIWLDSDEDGLQTGNDPFTDTVTVNLLDSNNNVVSTTQTSSGYYTFTVPVSTSHRIQFEQPTGYFFTTPDAGADALDSDAKPSGHTAVFSIGTTNDYTIDAGLVKDSDNDALTDLTEGCAPSDDRDGDGTPNCFDTDPQGWIYDESTGAIVPGGSITVTGPGLINITKDGSTGEYQWFIDGTAGVYTMTVTPPAGYLFSMTCLRSDPPAYDPTGTTTDPSIFLGSADTGGSLGDALCANNVFYLTFDLAAGDPFVMSNNIPLKQVPTCDVGANDLGGTIFRDLNSDGIQAVNEQGFDGGAVGMTVTAYGNDDTTGITVSINSDGTYNFPALFDTMTHVRLEFAGLPSYMQPSFHGSTPGSATLTQRHSAATCEADLAIHNSADYCQSIPELATTCFVNGDPLAAGSGSATLDTLVSFDYTAADKGATINKVGAANQTGTIWGIAHEPNSNRLFTSAVVRRHSGLGPSGLGAIYVSDPPTAAPVEFVVLPDVGTIPDNATRGLTATVTAPSRDVAAYTGVATLGIGDIDLSDDGSKLYAVNLAQGRVDVVDTTTKAISSLPAITDPSCTNGVARPWALTVHDGKIYVGVVCSGESAGGTQANLSAHIYAYDGTAWGTTSEISFDLNYPRSCTYENGEETGCGGWQPWIDEHSDIPAASFIFGGHFFGHPTPVLSDIEFDIDGSMILSFLDRTALQYGSYNYQPLTTDSRLYDAVSAGDILRVHNIGGNYVLEANGTASDPTTAGKDNAQGPGGGEYYFEEDYTATNDNHFERVVGGVALLPTSGQVVAAVMDPPINNGGNILGSGGLDWYSNSDGTHQRSLQLYQGSNNDLGYFGKSVGLGDVELICNAAPLEIGNYVWLDTDNDGVQDPCETPLAGVTVTLYNITGTAVATTITDAKGEYYFSNNTVSDQVWSVGTGLTANTAYTLGIDLSQTVTISGTPTLLSSLTPSPIGGSGDSQASNDEHDSDGTLNGNRVETAVLTGMAGHNDHSFDFGFSSASEGELVVQKTVNWNGNTPDGSQQFAITVTGANFLTTTQINDGGSFTFTLPTGTYTVTEASPGAGWVTTYTVASVASGTSGVATVSDTPTQVAILNTAPDASLKIGNYVWVDTDGDGEQNEGGTTGIPSVEVRLYSDIGNTLVATTTTDATGHYTFTKALHNITENTDYVIRIDTNQPALSAYDPTSANTVSDTVDSDGVLVSGGTFDGYVATPASSPANGNVDYSFDFGFVLPPADWGDLPTTSAVTRAENGPHHFSPSGTMTATVWLGANRPDYEADGVESLAADGDDMAGTPDDEDGFLLFNYPIPGESMPTFIEVSGSEPTADIGYWIDWDANGFFTDTVDFFEFYDNYPTGNTTTPSYIEQVVAVPTVVALGQHRVRIRAYSADFATEADHTAVLSTGAATDGEIEDHLISPDFTAVGFTQLDTLISHPPFLLLTTVLALLGLTAGLWRRRTFLRSSLRRFVMQYQNRTLFFNATFRPNLHNVRPRFLLLLTGFLMVSFATSLFNGVASAQMTGDVDLITNISSDKAIVDPLLDVTYSVTVENRGPDSASNALLTLDVKAGTTITGTSCVATAGSTCPAAYSITDGVAGAVLTATMPLLADDGVLTFSFSAPATAVGGNYKVKSTVTAVNETDSVPGTNSADLNISVTDVRLSAKVEKTVVRYEDSGGTTVASPVAGGRVVYDITVTNDGIDDITNLTLDEEFGVGIGTATAAGSSSATRSTGYFFTLYSPGAGLLTTTCTAANGGVCPTTIAAPIVVRTPPESGKTAVFDIKIPFLPGRTIGAASNPVAFPSSSVSFEVTADVGTPRCSTAPNTTREILNKGTITLPKGLSETPLTAPYGAGSSADNESEIIVNMPAPLCNEYDISAQVTESAAQAANGIDEGGAFTYQVQVVNGGPSATTDVPFAFGQSAAGPLSFVTDASKWLTIPTLSSTVSCTPAGGAVCPVGYTVTPFNADGDDRVSTTSEMPIINATIPTMPSGGSLTFTITGTGGAFEDACLPRNLQAYAIALPSPSGNDTNFAIDPFYLSSLSNGSTANGVKMGNNAFNLRTQWNTNVPCGQTSYDLSENTTGPFAQPSDTTPIAGALAPGQLVYFKLRTSNIAPGIPFSSEEGLFLNFNKVPAAFAPFPSWLDTEVGSGFGFSNKVTADDTAIAFSESDITCTATNGASCPAPDQDVFLSLIPGTYGANINGGAIDGFTLTVGSTLDFVVPYRVPPAKVPCLVGGATFSDVGTFFTDRIANSLPSQGPPSDRDPFNESTITPFDITIPDCSTALTIDKRVVAPASATVLPADGVVRYEVDLGVAGGNALDVARFTDIASAVCSEGTGCGSAEITNIVSCTVIAGNAACPASFPIGQRRAQNGTLTPITAGTLDTSWGTPNASTVVGGAAFEPGGSIRIVMDVALSDQTARLQTLANVAGFYSDPDTSLFGDQLNQGDRVEISPAAPSSMFLNKQVTPSSVQLGETITYTLEVINNGPDNGNGAVLSDTISAELIASNPTGFQNVTCSPITTTPPLRTPAVVANCANVTLNNTASGLSASFGDWPANSGYRIRYTVVAPNTGTSTPNTADLTPPASTATLRFNGSTNSSVNVRVSPVVTGELVVGKTVDWNGNIPDGGQQFDITVMGNGVLTTTQLNDGGTFTFTLPVGTYTVTEASPGVGWVTTYTVNSVASSTGGVATVSDTPSSVAILNTAPDATLKTLEIGNYVWVDSNKDGQQNEGGTTGIPGVVVALYPPIGITPVATTTTDATGHYTFTKSADGIFPDQNYIIRIDGNQPALSQYEPTVTDAVSNTVDAIDSDGSPITVGPFDGYVATFITTPSNGETDYTFDYGYIEPPILGAIGNYVWLDENADGQQDEGERGIPNVIVNMVDGVGTVYTTTTDLNGGYLFPDLPQGTYTVTIPTSNSAPDGPLEDFEQTQLTGGDADFGNKNEQGYVIELGNGEENLTADFGYNPDPDDTNGGTNNAALGDYVWIDSDGDGAQDSGETPVEGVELTLYSDPDGDGIFDTVVATDTTDATGYYLFDELPPAAYVVRVTDSVSATHDVLNTINYTQTGDPDHFGTTGTNNDNASEPVVLAPGDVFLNVDFGYQPDITAPDPDALNSIGDTVWMDADADGNGPALAPIDGGAPVNQGDGVEDDAAEQPIAGVTVSLINDLDGDGIWDAGEPIISTDTTDENGQYLFSDLPDGDYIVWVNDTDNVLDGLRPTYDDDGIATQNISAVDLDSAGVDDDPVDERDQDFGYTPEAQEPGLGAIGDTVWFDTDRSGGATQDVGEPGIEGVTVTLTDENGNTQTTTTDENGSYLFAGLPLSTTYTVTIDASNFITGGVLAGMEQTYDEDAPLDNMSSTTLTAADPVDLDQDFSYVGDDANTLGSIGNRVWLDQNADGDYDGANGPDGVANTDDDESGIEGVTIDLYRDLNGNGVVDPGEPKVGSDTTDADGLYLFEELPLGDYVVDVTDEDGVLAGHWHSLGTQDASTNGGNDANDQSKADPFAVTIDETTPDNLNVDFGYYVEPAALGNYVWLDSNDNGLQDDGETGINGVEVQLVVAYVDGTSITLTAVTENDAAGNPGFYEFTNLLLDEDYNTGVTGTVPTADSPLFTMSVDTTQASVSNYKPADVDVNTNGNDKEDSDDHAGVTAVPTQGLTDTSAQDPETDEQTIASYDFGFVEPSVLGAIGNYVWMDENADGQQDEGERGIPNVIVNMVDQDGTVYTTTTDTDGGYLFPDLPAGTYTVTIPVSNFANGGALEDLEQTPLVGGNADFGNKEDAGYPIELSAGEENLTADFGYNPDPENANNNELLAALGDYVWIDSDGDGAQNAGETPVEGVELTLFSDPDGDGIFDTVVATDTTDATGYYLFDELPPAAYVVRVTDSVSATHNVLGDTYNQTGDPDHFGTTGTNNDNASEPVILAPGDTFLNVDFGYQPDPTAPTPAVLGSIGDTVWLDIDASGTPIQDAGEPGIEGVTVALISDENGNGVWDAGEPIISTDTTDEDGKYLFVGLPVDEHYIVWVNDTDNVLDGLNQTYDQDAPLDNMSATELTTGVPNDLNQDFSYTPEGQEPGEGAIGDTIWLNIDSDNEQDPNEPGIEGVEVELTFPDGSTITTTTDENGNYYFGGLDPNGTYTVTVITSTLPAGLVNTADPDGNIPSQSVVPLTPQNPIDLDQDFGYTPPSSEEARIGNLVWLDQNADGTWDGEAGPDGVLGTDDDEPPLAGVTIDLYVDENGNGVVDAGEPLIGSTTTVGSIITGTYGDGGNYIFEGLPAGDYVVDVTDEDGVLNGYWHSDGPNDGDDDNSQTDTYAVTVAAGGENLTADFGYYVEPAAVGNYVWLDSNDNGLQDDGETGINGVDVQMVVAYPDGTSITLTTVTENDAAGNSGFYEFTNLLLDEDFAIGSATGAPTANAPAFTISVDTTQAAVSAYTPAMVDVNTNGNDKEDSDNHSGVTAIPVQGLTDTSAQDPETNEQAIASYDFGFVEPPLLGAIGNYIWVDENADGAQDEGERGIPNVIVNLTDGNGNVFTTTTDTSGGYLFPDLPAGTYTVTVSPVNFLTGGALEGMEQTPLVGGDADFGNKDDAGYPIELGAGEENLTADFGYNPNDPDDVNNNTNSAALGDYVWIDSDGDGAQDEGELPVEGVVLVLYSDPDGDGVYDTPIMTDTTDANGYYLFDNLPAGSYVVEVVDSSAANHDVLEAGEYSQTGDPDHFGTTGTNNDNASEPVVLAPGDVFLNVDFGYQPEDTTPLNTIGDTVWLDIDADGVEDADEDGIEGVAVALIEDTNGNGVWDLGEPIVAVDTTDEDGMYLFEDLPDGDYIVWVNDTDNVLDGLDQTYDQDAPLDNMSATSVNGGQTDLDQDFGYTPEGQVQGEGAIGDTIFFNGDGDDTQDPDEPGIEGVVVQLELPDGSIITTTTNENGNYYFGGLDPDATYTVTVPVENFGPGGPLEGLDPTADPDSQPSPDNVSVVTLTPQEPIDLDQDFGYTPPVAERGSIGNRVWLDQNADGDWDGANGPDGVANTDDDETGIAGVTVDLYRDLNGNGVVDADEPLFGSTTTAADGTYLFDTLPLGDYVVDVTDEDGVLNGYWHSLGAQNVYAGDPTADEQDQSKSDTVAVTIGDGNPNDNLNVDFGYYVEPAAVGNYVWIDSNNNGLQDSDETPLDGVMLTLMIAYPDGSMVTLTTVSGDDPSTAAVETGWYSFGNLLLDEDYNMGSGAVTATTLPGFKVSAETPTSYVNAKINVGSATDDKNDSDDHAGVAAVPVQGLTAVAQDADPLAEQTIAGYDFGYVKAVKIGNYVWIEEDGDGELGSGEVVTPVVGIVITATALDGSVYTGTTDSNGLYTITVPINQVYTITVGTPPGTTPSNVPGNPGDEQNHGTTFPVTVGEEDDLTLDIAFTLDELYAIGNFVWIDEGTADGVYDSNTESGVGGVRVELYKGGQLVTFTTTTSDGAYLFDRLVGGDYTVVITTSNFIMGGALYDGGMSVPLEPSPLATGADDVMVGTGNPLIGVSASVTVGDAPEPTGEDEHNLTPSVDDENADLTVDFGFFVPDQTAVHMNAVQARTSQYSLTGLLLMAFAASMIVVTIAQRRLEK